MTENSHPITHDACIIDEILGETLRPGGLDLTARITEIADIQSRHQVLDIGCGKGTTAVFLAQRYACRVMGIDLSGPMVLASQAKAVEGDLTGRISFLQADGEDLPFDDAAFDVVMCECTFSLMPHPEKAAQEIRRVLKPQGRFIFSDIVLRSNVDSYLRTQISFPCCLSGSVSLEEYLRLFKKAGFDPYYVEDQSDQLAEIGFHLGLALGDLLPCTNQITYGACRQKTRRPALISPELLWQFLGQGRPGYAVIIMNKI